MRRLRKTIGQLSMVSLVCSLAVCTLQSRAQRAQDISVSYSLVSTQLTLHEPAILEFVVKNGSDKSIQLHLGANNKQSFLITITRPDRTRVPVPPIFREGLATTGLELVAPGHEYKQRLVLNEWFIFGVPGHYEVEVRLTQPVKTAEGIAVAEVAPFHTSLEILPRDPQRLKDVCISLVEQIKSAPSYVAALEAALPLSYVQDPIAVPYLEKALYAGHLVELNAIDGLRRIANQEAVQVLISALGSGHPETTLDTPTMAEAALGMIAYQTHDPALKETIQRALQHANEKKP